MVTDVLNDRAEIRSLWVDAVEKLFWPHRDVSLIRP
jgi:hypothetical protein